jgi:multidrug resistance protein, MATE family
MQNLGAYINLAGYYIIGLPVGLVCTFKYGLGLTGLWIGLTVGLLFCSVAQLSIISITDWRKQATKAQCLVGERSRRRSDTESSSSLLPTTNDTSAA